MNPEWETEQRTGLRFPDQDGEYDEEPTPMYLPYDGPKMLSVAGDIHRPYNPADLERRESFVCIAEGEWDAMIAHQDGLPCIGIQGVNGWKPDFRRLFTGYKAVYILADNDDKGQGGDFAEKVAATIPNARVVMMPEGHDVNSWYIQNGPGSVRARVEETE
ncbi:toprim domain-containing protein [Actinoplanes sp. CA-054009]